MPADGVLIASIQRGGDDAWLEGYDYRRSEVGTVPTWLPLRLPGQYHDPETDFFENWNRNYDAGAGRYLSTESFLMSPTFVSQSNGNSIPMSCAYAGNNPVANSDATGLVVRLRGSPSERLRSAIRECLSSETCRSMWDSMSESETVFNVYESSEPAGPGRNKEVSERVVDIMFRFEAGGGVPNWFTVAHEFAHATGYLDGVSKRVVHQPSKEHERRWGDGLSDPLIRMSECDRTHCGA